MRRAIQIAALAACCVAWLAPGPARAQRKTVDVINAIGLVDYGQKPHLKVGQWVRYHTVGASEKGMSDDYTVTALISGEERFWGDDGFWMESWTEHASRPPRAIATLVSYAIFQDSLPVLRLQTYIRKTVQEVDDAGNPKQTIARRPPGTLKSRTPFTEGMTWDVDTVGRDTVHTPRGTFDCVQVRIRSANGQTLDVGDSTFFNVIEEVRTVHMTNQIPITHIAREDIVTTVTREAWKVGRSQEKTLRVLERSRGSARLIDFGDSLEPRITPFQFRSSLAEQFPPRAAAPAPKPRSTGGARR
jgi:hypothetical protein